MLHILSPPGDWERDVQVSDVEEKKKAENGFNSTSPCPNQLTLAPKMKR